ncbi:uncharacterized protein B0I36DRAFT_365243 [Microdochium trichocladiopsis]|uniref:Peptidoglycan binding-like domain-containing protein n=1 Tax=Microdochium trichocladiopsis TaxID=1682393 RepID=A0A9P9BSA8_9PEZI|nr:uncharacterized protein B0I36DRAFT_365243 [Microdochium trichocladiopsis]KAH7028135.1 hypothetical protein B0I36DRAFT_365243 [Microdochium trichocladiopsis]
MKLLALSTILASAALAASTCNDYKVFRGSHGYDVWLPVNSGSKTCEMGANAQSDAVYILQTTLNSKCYNYGLEEDGIFGPKTVAALKKAQAKHGAAADGVYGPETRDKIAWDAYKAGAVTCLKLSQT